jgi:copper chaperone CopZ
VPQMTLYAPDITCDHCIATIHRTVDGIEGARFLSGDPEAKSFVVEVAGGAILDRLAEALAAEGYPLGEAGAPPDAAHTDGHGEGVDPRSVGWTPAYRVSRTDKGADVNYACYCGCEAGFALDRSQPEQAPEGCCCGNRILVGRDSSTRLQPALESGSNYRVELAQLTMPWGQPVEVALAVPAE